MMKCIFFIFLFLFGEQVHSQNTRLGNDNVEKLFKDGKGFRYILLKGDTAYYESQQPDKIPYFIPLDTLVRLKDSNSNLFDGTKGKMTIMDSVIRLIMDSATQKKESIVNFLPATTEQIIDWNKSKNRLSYLELNSILNKFLFAKQPTPDRRKRIENEWKDISKYIWIFNYKEFDSVLTNFKNKYSIY